MLRRILTGFSAALSAALITAWIVVPHINLNGVTLSEAEGVCGSMAALDPKDCAQIDQIGMFVNVIGVLGLVFAAITTVACVSIYRNAKKGY